MVAGLVLGAALGVRALDAAAAAGAEAGAGHGEEERVAQCGALHLHAVPSLQCSVDQLLQGGEDSEDSEDSLHRQHRGLRPCPRPAGHGHADRGPEHTELVAGLRGLPVAGRIF